MKEGLQEIIGKTINAVVVKEGGSPRSQIYLAFTDDTHLEFYCDYGVIWFGSHVDLGGVNRINSILDGGRVVVISDPTARRRVPCYLTRFIKWIRSV